MSDRVYSIPEVANVLHAPLAKTRAYIKASGVLTTKRAGLVCLDRDALSYLIMYYNAGGHAVQMPNDDIVKDAVVQVEEAAHETENEEPFEPPKKRTVRRKQMPAKKETVKKARPKYVAPSAAEYRTLIRRIAALEKLLARIGVLAKGEVKSRKRK